ncbi:protein containing DUF721 [Candidatus Magnetomorum sp. HK-1]|nr:protein containing DUF721 [Candidatus Magnetomorum sp. HK-1]
MDNKKAKQEPLHIKSIVEGLMKKYSNTKGADLFQISEIWESVVGKTIANDARPWKIKGKELEIHVSGSVWLHQLNYMKADMIQKLNDRIGDTAIEKIRLKIGNINH